MVKPYFDFQKFLNVAGFAIKLFFILLLTLFQISSDFFKKSPSLIEKIHLFSFNIIGSQISAYFWKDYE